MLMSETHRFESEGDSFLPFCVILGAPFCFTARLLPSFCALPGTGLAVDELLIVEA